MHSRAIKRERKKERPPCYCRRKAFKRESLTEERIERLFSSLALLLRRRLRKTLIHEYYDGKDTAKEKADEGKTPTTTTRRGRTEDDKEDKEDKKEEQKRFRKRSFKSSRGKDIYHHPRSSSKTTFLRFVNLNFVSSLLGKRETFSRERLNHPPFLDLRHVS